MASPAGWKRILGAGTAGDAATRFADPPGAVKHGRRVCCVVTTVAFAVLPFGERQRGFRSPWIARCIDAPGQGRLGTGSSKVRPEPA